MKEIKDILRSLGLLDSEVKVYMSGLKHGAGTILDFSKKTRLSRQAVYTAINALVERGLISSTLRGKKKFFASEHPRQLLAYAKRYSQDLEAKVGELKHMVPELALQMGGDRPIVKLFEGREGLKAIVEEKAKTHYTDSYEITDVDALYQIFPPEELAPMRKKLKRRGVSVHGLYSGSTSEKTLSGKRVMLGKEYSDFKSDIAVYGDKIEMVTFEGKMYSLIIESKLLARTITILFELAHKGISKK